jgi:hypothetical protein
MFGTIGRVRRLVSLALLIALAGVASASASSTARVRFLSIDPVKVRGTGFYARERVRVTLRGPDMRRVRTVTTSARGAFTARFGGVTGFDRCTDSLYVAAAGRRGDRAGAKLPQPQCPPL